MKIKDLIKSNYILIGYVMSFLLIIFSFVYFYNTTYQNYKNKKVNLAIENTQKEKIIKESLLYQAPNENDHYKIKNANAKVTVINYISLDCPHCKEAYLLEDNNLYKYKNMSLIYRHNPLDIQPLSPEKALIAECVFENTLEDKVFFDFISKAFSDFDKDNKNNIWFKKMAYNFVKSKEAFNLCLEADVIKESIQNTKYKNIISGINYTPTLLVFVDGRFEKKFENLNAKQVIKILDFYSSKSF